MKLLRIDSSARRNSVSRQLTSRFVETWKKENPKGEVIERDLATTHLPPITDEWTLAAYSDPASLSTSQKRVLALSNTLVEELLAADTIVIGAPMHSFTISALLKGWIDQVVRVGRTVLFNPNGPQGLLSGKKAGSDHVAERFVSRRYSDRPIRLSGALFAAHPGFRGIDRCHFHPR